MLEDSLFVVAVAVQGEEGSMARGDLPRIAARHSRNDLDIRPELYDLWAECLVATARECDPGFGPRSSGRGARCWGSASATCASATSLPGACSRWRRSDAE